MSNLASSSLKYTYRSKSKHMNVMHEFGLVFFRRSLPEIDGLSKETVLTSWMAKFDMIIKGNHFSNNLNEIHLI